MIHTYQCPGQLIGGQCPTPVPCECVGPYSQAGGVFSCAGTELCEDCSAAIYAGERCDSCGLIDASVSGPGPKDRYCKDCLAMTDKPVAEPTHGVARE